MDLLDAQALVAFITGEAALPIVEGIIREGNSVITTVNLAEVLYILTRRHGIPQDQCRSTLGGLLNSAIGVRDANQSHAWRAADIRLRHYHHKKCSISNADSVLMAAAGPGDRIATADRDLLKVAREEGIEVIALPR